MNVADVQDLIAKARAVVALHDAMVDEVETSPSAQPEGDPFLRWCEVVDDLRAVLDRLEPLQ